MRPFWSPLSALLLGEPPVFAPAFLLRRLLSKGVAIDLVYAGDRMWPAVRHGQSIRLEPSGGSAPRPGEVVVAAPAEIPDLLRVDRVAGGRLVLRADADPAESVTISEAEVLGRAGSAPRRVWSISRAARRLAVDLREALTQGPDPRRDAAGTVQLKYETQAPFYQHGQVEPLPAALLERIRSRVPAGGRVLVAGSGAGVECFALARGGFEPVGVDFSAAMVAQARREAERQRQPVTFHADDLRSHEEPAASFDAVLFTYNVYSFIPGSGERTSMLRKMARWLRPGGAIFLSPRIGRGLYDRCIVSLQRLAPGPREERGWGGSHTRWIAPDGSLHRSFVKVFTPRSLMRETKAAGLAPGEWEGGHITLTVRAGRTRPSG